MRHEGGGGQSPGRGPGTGAHWEPRIPLWRTDPTVSPISHPQAGWPVLAWGIDSPTNLVHFTWSLSQVLRTSLCLDILPSLKILHNNLFCLPCLRWQCALCFLSSLLFFPSTEVFWEHQIFNLFVDFKFLIPFWRPLEVCHETPHSPSTYCMWPSFRVDFRYANSNPWARASRGRWPRSSKKEELAKRVCLVQEKGGHGGHPETPGCLISSCRGCWNHSSIPHPILTQGCRGCSLAHPPHRAWQQLLRPESSSRRSSQPPFWRTFRAGCKENFFFFFPHEGERLKSSAKENPKR